MSEMRKQLPSGDWISFQKLSAETTDVDVQAFLAEKGIELPLERISVDCTTDGRKAYAIISLQRSHIVDLVWRAETYRAFCGMTGTTACPRSLSSPIARHTRATMCERCKEIIA